MQNSIETHLTDGEHGSFFSKVTFLYILYYAQQRKALSRLFISFVFLPNPVNRNPLRLCFNSAQHIQKFGKCEFQIAIN